MVYYVVKYVVKYVGSTSPNCSGRYNYAGVINRKPYYKHISQNWYIFVNNPLLPDAYLMRHSSGGHNGWKRDTAVGIQGIYQPYGEYFGNPVVSVGRKNSIYSPTNLGIYGAIYSLFNHLKNSIFGD